MSCCRAMKNSCRHTSASTAKPLKKSAEHWVDYCNRFNALARQMMETSDEAMRAAVRAADPQAQFDDTFHDVVHILVSPGKEADVRAALDALISAKP